SAIRVRGPLVVNVPVPDSLREPAAVALMAPELLLIVPLMVMPPVLAPVAVSVTELAPGAVTAVPVSARMPTPVLPPPLPRGAPRLPGGASPPPRPPPAGRRREGWPRCGPPGGGPRGAPGRGRSRAPPHPRGPRH